MNDGLAPAPREQGWLRIVLALAAFLLLSHAPGLRAVLPVEDTLLLLLPALAVYFIVGWWAGGPLTLAVLWLALTAWLFLLPVPQGASRAYYDLARAWGLLVAGAFGVVCVVGRRRPFLERALSAIGIAMLLALLLVALGRLEPRQAQKVFAEEFVTRIAKTAATWRATAAEMAKQSPSASEWFSQLTAQNLELHRKWAAAAAPLYPALLGLESLAACALAWGLYHRLSRARLGPPLAALRDFAFNDQLVWGLLAGFTIFVLPAFRPLTYVGLNLVVFLGALYALRGFGIFAWFLPRGRSPVGILFGIAALVLFALSLPAAFILGVTDTWFDWRRRARVDSSPNHPGPLNK